VRQVACVTRTCGRGDMRETAVYMHTQLRACPILPSCLPPPRELRQTARRSRGMARWRQAHPRGIVLREESIQTNVVLCRATLLSWHLLASRKAACQHHYSRTAFPQARLSPAHTQSHVLLTAGSERVWCCAVAHDSRPCYTTLYRPDMLLC
jgi:hypothetical protein